MFAALPMYRPSLPHPGATPNVSPVTRECCTRAAGENSMFTALPTYKPSLPRCPASARYYPTRLFSHARKLPPRSGRNLHVRCLSNVRAVAVTLPRARVSQTQRVQPPCSQPFQRTGCLCPAPVLPRTSPLSRLNAAPAQRAKPPCLQPFQRTSRLCPAAPLPRVSAVLPHASLQSRSNAAPAQRAQPPCLLSFQRASRRCHAAPRRFRYCSERLFRHAQSLPPRRGCNLHV